LGRRCCLLRIPHVTPCLFAEFWISPASFLFERLLPPAWRFPRMYPTPTLCSICPCVPLPLLTGEPDTRNSYSHGSQLHQMVCPAIPPYPSMLHRRGSLRAIRDLATSTQNGVLLNYVSHSRPSHEEMLHPLSTPLPIHKERPTCVSTYTFRRESKTRIISDSPLFCPPE